MVRVTLLLAALGGAVGAVLRWKLSSLNDMPDGIPWGTLAANMAGSLLLGLLVGGSSDPLLAASLGAGVLGGLTTFSTFTVEGLRLPPRRAVVYLGGSLVLGVAFAALGLALGRGLSG